MNIFVKQTRTEESQKTAVFTGEGAYHGSSKTKEAKAYTGESEASTLMSYLKDKKSEFATFEGTFPNLYEVKRSLRVPTQDEIKNDGVTFVWCEFDDAIKEAGPLTKSILQEMDSLLERNKKFIYIDSKIQYFHENDLAVDSSLWHIDGSIAIRDERAKDLGYTLLHDMKARLLGPIPPAKYLAYQSSYHCATQFITEPLTITMPDCIPSFDTLDTLVKAANPTYVSQPAGSIVRFDGLSLHRAIPAMHEGWRLWIRCIETDKEVKLNTSVVECYGTVFRTNI